MTPGFQITLPSGWVKPFGGMTISLNLPLAEKYQLRGYFDINGSGALTMGTSILGDMTKKMTANWKTQDQKALDKAANEAKGQGYMAETKAKTAATGRGAVNGNPSPWERFHLTSAFSPLCRCSIPRTAMITGASSARAARALPPP